MGAVTTYYKRLEAVMDQYARKYDASVESAAKLIATCLRGSGRLFTCGNGGSAADAQHIAGEIVGRYLKERRGYAAEALSTDTSVITAIGNDYGFDEIFRRQLEAKAQKGDVLLAISTSGNSPNVINAVMYARENRIYTIGLLGKDGGKLAPLVDMPIVVRDSMTPVVQTVHNIIYHCLCQRVEEILTQSRKD